MASSTDSPRWKAAVLVQPSVTASSTASGAALTALLTGLAVRLEGPGAPLVATRSAALVAQLAAAEAVAVRFTVRGHARLSGGATVSAVVVADGRTSVLDTTPDASGGWTAEFEVARSAGGSAAYPLAVLLVGSRPSPDAVVDAVVESLDLVAMAAADAATAPPAADDDDPAAPPADGPEPAEALARARDVANFGADGQARARDVGPPAGVGPVALDVSRAQGFLRACMTSQPRVTYGLGAKLPRHGAVPGQDFTKVDCSGFVREAVWLSTTPHLNFPDGSVVQHEWVRARLPKSTIAAAQAADGVVRIAFLRPEDSPKGIGHVVLVLNGRTLESHGGVGPDSRDWTGEGWQAKAFVYTVPSTLA